MWTETILAHCLLSYLLASLLPFPLTFSFLCFGDSGDFSLLNGVCCSADAANVLLLGPLTSTDVVPLLSEAL